MRAAAAGSLSPLIDRLNSTRCVHVNTHRIADAKEKCTRVLHSPPDIRHAEVSGDIQPGGGGDSLDQYCHLVVLSVNSK